jgi:hypothetical protein
LLRGPEFPVTCGAIYCSPPAPLVEDVVAIVRRPTESM